MNEDNMTTAMVTTPLLGYEYQQYIAALSRPVVAQELMNKPERPITATTTKSAPIKRK